MHSVGSVIVNIINHASRILTNFPKAISSEKETRKKRIRTFLTIIEKTSGEFLVANVEIVSETRTKKNLYTFVRANGKTLRVNLSDGNYRIIRKKEVI